MHDRSQFLLVYGADPVKWAKRYGIDPFEHPCYECGHVQKTIIPFASGYLRGLIAPSHDCPKPGRLKNAGPPYCIVAPGCGGDLTALFPVKPKKKRNNK